MAAMRVILSVTHNCLTMTPPLLPTDDPESPFQTAKIELPILASRTDLITPHPFDDRASDFSSYASTQVALGGA
jgi:hypothetical protein